jgi:hypothetical protein
MDFLLNKYSNETLSNKNNNIWELHKKLLGNMHVSVYFYDFISADKKYFCYKNKRLVKVMFCYWLKSGLKPCFE